MKVTVHQTVEISEEQRLQLGAVLTGKIKPKHWATRDQIKEFLWEKGEGWAVELAELYSAAFETTEEPDVDGLLKAYEEGRLSPSDLLGDEDEDLLGEDLL